LALRLAVLLIPSATAGCLSFSYVDENNVRHVVGFVDMTIPADSRTQGDAAAQAVVVTSVGLSVHTHRENNSSVVLGFSRQTVLAVGNNACIDLQRAGPCASLRASASAPQSNIGGKK
jgi:hypothetical protein